MSTIRSFQAILIGILVGIILIFGILTQESLFLFGILLSALFIVILIDKSGEQSV